MTRPSDIGRQLVALRREHGLAQAELASRLGLKRQQVQRWEASEYRNVSLVRIDRVADALGWQPVSGTSQPLAAEAQAAYATALPGQGGPVRDLAAVITRIRAHADELHDRFGVASIDVFGSFARGDQTAESDVDLIVEVEAPTMETVFGAERRLEEILARPTEAGSIRAVNPNIRPRVEKERVHVWSA